MPRRPSPSRSTSTSNFGVGRREAHDASPFYQRFQPPELSDDAEIQPPKPVAEPFLCGDARSMTDVATGSVALVVTSPPYFAGKQYEEELERDGVPGSYLEYLELLTDVFAECTRTLEPGGRIAVNVANLGRKPYRSLSADVIRILQDRLGLLLRGELIWQKGEGATGSCAWGSFRAATNPVLRDLTERVVIASKGRFSRVRTPAQRQAEGLPSESTLGAEDFMALTLDVWPIPAERAHRVGHPAPFPVELPAQLIRLYTFLDDLVLDPFMGSGSSLVAAAQLGRRYVGYDLDPAYVAIARRRVADEAELAPEGRSRDDRPAATLAEEALIEAGFTLSGRNVRVRGSGVTVSFSATDRGGGRWLFDVAGANTSLRGGMQRSEVALRALARAAAVRGRTPADVPLVLLTTAAPRRPGEADTMVRSAGAGVVFDVVDTTSPGGRSRLSHYAGSGPGNGPELGFWTRADLSGLTR